MAKSGMLSFMIKENIPTREPIERSEVKISPTTVVNLVVANE